MTSRLTGARLAVAALAGGLVLGGCGQAPTHDDVVSSESVTTRDMVSTKAPSTPSSSLASGVRAGRPRVAKQPPSLPPGDPGPGAPSIPDPGAAGAERPGQEGARRTVPVGAMLTAGAVRSVLGGGWERRSGGEDECVRPQGALGVRVMSYGGAAAGLVSETVATYRDAASADAAVKALGSAAASCGWTGVTDPRLGSASVSAQDGDRSLVAVSSEGVLVLLVGGGEATRDPSRWGSLVDLAVGSSCPAAPDGCH